MKVGLIGTGYWGSIIRTKLQQDTIDLLFEADSKFDYKPFLREVDWVFVATPPKTHFNIVDSVLSTGVSVFCEKPLTGDPELSKDLFLTASDNKSKLFVDNIFLKRREYQSFRKEVLSSHTTDITTIEFVWEKHGPFKDSLVNDLLYHDITLLLDLVGFDIKDSDIQKQKVHYSDNRLYLDLKIGDLNVIFNYDRMVEKKRKKIIVNNSVECDLTVPIHDPLGETINAVLFEPESIDFEFNKRMTLHAEHLFTRLVSICNNNLSCN